MNKWDFAHMRTAENYAKLSSAKRAQVGCVLVKDNRILSIGYNGMPSGWDNQCEYYDSTRDDVVTKPEVLHAETNALAKVACSSESSEGSVLYTTMLPCLDCAKLIYQSKISRVVYRDTYPKGTAGKDFLVKCGIEVTKL